MIKILLAEDHNIVRNGIRILLEAEPRFQVIAEAVNGLEVEALLQNGIQVDLILADINMPEMDGITMLKGVQQAYPDIKVIMLSMYDNMKYVSESFRAGALGYLLKSVDAEELIFAIKHVYSGKKYICAAISLNLLNRSENLVAETAQGDVSDLAFTGREIEVLLLIAAGFTNQEMANKLFMSKRTVEGHRQTLIEKTGSRNTAALVHFAVLHQLIQ